MKYYFAPMEGITGFVYRRAHSLCFPGIDKYFTPFLSPNQNHRFSPREKADVDPENNPGLQLIPQLLTNRAQDFIWAAKELESYGYKEVNINLGCPSKTVVSKNKGAGFLADQEELNLFLDEIFSRTNIRISVKIRLGKDQPEEFYELIRIFNRYPMEELIIHPRIQRDFYDNEPNMKVFGDALAISVHPVCYNGDIFHANTFRELMESFPQIERVMCGRGLTANPGLAREFQGMGGMVKEELRKFHDLVYQGYQDTIPGERNVLFKMKELWYYMICMFSNYTTFARRIRKTEHLSEYEAEVSVLFRERELAAEPGFSL